MIYDRRRKAVQLIDIAIPGSYNMKAVYEEKKKKYEELGIHIKKVRKAENIEIIPIVMSSVENCGNPLSYIAISTILNFENTYLLD